nr:RNA-directed DNA polymerase, eukaryota [Tanacetum cinerariifolium]
RFWNDLWISDGLLRDRFSRLFALEMDKEVLVAVKLGASSVADSFRRGVRDGTERQQWSDLSSLLAWVSLSSSKDRWICGLTGDGKFKVKAVRNSPDDLFLPSQAVATRWVKFIPIKVNVFAWRARRDRLPTRLNLSRRDLLVVGVGLASLKFFFGLKWVVSFYSASFVYQVYLGRDEQPILTESNNVRANLCQEGGSNEHMIDNSNRRNENIHTNTTDIKEATFNNRVSDGTEATNSSWPPGSQIEGRWLDVNLDIYMVNVYAPQDEEGKQNLWIYILSLYVPMGGYKFTRVDRYCTKGSRLDRFLIADSTWNSLGPLTAVALDRTISDHHPILLRRFMADYGPIPFKIFHSWFQGECFDNVVSEFWCNGYYRRSSSALINFKNKLQGLKGVIKVWVNARRSRIEVMDSLSEELRNLDLNIDVRQDLHHGGEQRMKHVNEIHKLECEQKDDLIQKSRIKWCVDGDENSKFFHGTINKKMKQLSIRGIKSNCLWVEDPMAVKQTFFNHFSHKFAKVTSIPYSTRRSRFRLVSQHQLEILESEVSLEEIKDVVWDCGSDKSPGPDGFTFGFIKSAICFYQESTYFRRPVILNEVVQSLKRKKKKAKTFKVDITKAYDTLSWDYLISVIKFMGFGNKCVRWIKACLESARSSVLVNGSPTMEFQLECGLRQRDPLAPFLFILAMEGFHIAMEDDVIVMGEWSQSNLVNIFDIFNCFYLASGLQICVMKSKLYGIGVTEAELNHFAEAMRSKFFWGAEDTKRKIHWVKWDLVLASKDRGGLGFGSLHSLNLSLLYKWRWRFHNYPNALWTKIIKKLYHFSREVHGWNQLGIVGMAQVSLRIGDVPYVAILKMINIIGFMILSSKLLLSCQKILGDGLVIQWIRFQLMGYGIPSKLRCFGTLVNMSFLAVSFPRGLFGIVSKTPRSENRWHGLREWGFFSCLGLT